MEKLAVTSKQIDNLLARRWSPRCYNPDKYVSQEQIITLCEAARWAPSSGGDEPWRFIVFDKSTDFTNWEKALQCLDDYNQIWVKNVPLLILTIADSKWRNDPKPNRWAQHDTGAAGLSILLQAWSMGLIAHPMGGFNIDKVKSIFGIPDEFTPMAMIAVGYYGSHEILDDYNKKRELAPRKRKPLEMNFFKGHWGSPVNL